MPNTVLNIKNVWLLEEVLAKIRAYLNLPNCDEGIDLIAETHEGNCWAIQSKLRIPLNPITDSILSDQSFHFNRSPIPL